MNDVAIARALLTIIHLAVTVNYRHHFSFIALSVLLVTFQYRAVAHLGGV